MENRALHVFGLGSPVGLDAIGWCLVERLADDARFADVDCLALRDPASLPAALSVVTRAVVIDAVDWPLGQVGVISAEALVESAAVSSHALSVRDAIALAVKLQPALSVQIIGVGITGDGMDLQQLCDATLSRVVEHVCEAFGLG